MFKYNEVVFIKTGAIKGIVKEIGTGDNENKTKVKFFSPFNDKKDMCEWIENERLESFNEEKHPRIINKRKRQVAKQNQSKPVKWTVKESEIILVTPRATLFENEELHFQGVETNPVKVKRIVNNFANNVAMMRRIHAEENPNFKQVIPYTIIKKGDLIYTYKRLSGGGESRLFDKLSIGAGGHSNEVKGRNFFDTIKINTERELKEELDIKSKTRKINTFGLVNDDLESVGKVHIGLLNVLELDTDATVNVKETDTLEGEWLTIQELMEPDTFKRLESWSQYAATALAQDK